MAHPPPPPPPAVRALRQSAIGRIILLLLVFSILLAGAIWMLFHAPRTVQPENLPAPATLETTPVPAEITTPPALPDGEAVDLLIPALQDPLLAGEARMAQILALLRTAGEAARIGDVLTAEQDLQGVLRLDPRHAGAMRMLGGILLQRGQIARATALLEYSLQIEPYNPEGLTSLAIAYLQARDPSRAEEIIGVARRLYPAYAPALMQEGMILMALEDPSAVEVLRHAAEVMPQFSSIRNNLAVMLARQGEVQEARSILLTIVAENPRDSTAIFNLGLTYAREGNTTEAIEHLRQALALVPQTRQRELLNDRDLDLIRNTPAFQAFTASLDPAPPPPATQ